MPGKIWVSGSLAYDRIMDYPGRFAEHINPKKLHVINLSFAAKTLELSFGGTAGNIAYGLRLLKVPTGIIGNLGRDGGEYLARLKKTGADTACVRLFPQAFTAGAYMTTDRDDNQISAFFAGAMMNACKFPKTAPADMAIVSPDSAGNMARLAGFYEKRGVRFIFDPGQAITLLASAQLRVLLGRAWAVIGNDYEIDLIAKRSRFQPAKNQVLITTFGPKGSRIQTAGKNIQIPAVKPKRVVDPTGAGDAYRAGLLAGLYKGFSWEICASLGSTAATYAVETQGTQNYFFTGVDLRRRYRLNFNQRLNV